ncbi:NADH dehydrogenase subunit N [Paludibacter propionicigenes WB4]|uniref:NADH-quinone oxidoreductase subunit N n=1 Tax=Paludibacter propionicigenes (strain DSM 17365 / JCM 13257 / WB4) TaxID=694427 RepID=E4T1C9_PALPW|nr:NADH-quinone oxidoreductase subunit N [Paludibacter propionicigenes]ADQ78523.1 NADH dehydrogenase subunit N [Paludibacter propionicigenes WB4]
MDYSSFLQMREEFSLLGVMIFLLIFDIFASQKALKYFQPLALVLLTAHTIINCMPRDTFSIAGGMFEYQPIHTYVKSILNIGTIVVLLQAHKFLNEDANRIKRGEFYFLTLSTLLGMYFMISAGNFLIFFIGLETASIPMATLVAFDKYNRKSAEAGAKYILSAVFASSISVFGMSLIYGSTGTLYFADLATLITGTPLQIMAFVFFAVGLFFKISLVPFHLWTPDVYEGAQTNITSYLSVISKGSAVFVLFTLLVKVFANLVDQWQPILYGLAIVSITVANLFAIRQQNLKRFLAFSSISQAGYILLAIISGSTIGMASLVYYVLVYMFSNLAAFGVISVLEERTGKIKLDDYNGLYQSNPRLSFVLMLALFSLAGIPPFAGFFSKFFVFSAAIAQGYYVLVFIALLNTIISLYYYLLVIKAMFLNKSENPIETVKSDFPVKLSLVICTAGILVVGLISTIYSQISALSFGM